ncbi:PREDICTED: transport and Golgi organization protein 6 homolog [Nanorana parkeri]|uniref:transport and Golgi organization protein 6 homolog n=1 Tax=Nanorana parkeri TaxID=125878 RepID=UPI0008542196|nr:PREDICTED: transport and Golgi organization protein 6 homolog [Nanorana parkeri]
MAVALSVSEVTEALQILITPREPGSAAQDTDKQAALISTLQHNVASLEEELQNAPTLENLQTLRAKVFADTKLIQEGSEAGADPSWRFTSEALVLLLCLKECMVQLAASFIPPKPNLKTPEAAPALSPDALSIAQQKTVHSALQFVVSLGICPYLLPGIGLPLQHRSEFGALVCSMVSCDLSDVRTRRLYITCTALLELSRHPSLGSLLFTQHLGDLMAGLCQLGYCPIKTKAEPGTDGRVQNLTESERVQCKEALRGLMDQLYQPLVIRELLILQGGPRQGPRPLGASSSAQRAPAPTWLRRLSGQLLSERLMKPKGVQAVVRGILEGAGVGTAGGRDAEAAASNWKKCDAVAKILASCPQQSLTVEEYYQKVCPQILDLLHIQNKLTARQFQRVATETFLKMGHDQPELAEKLLIKPMLEPLLRCTALQAEKSLASEETFVSELELSRCVEDIVKVFVVGNDAAPSILNYCKQVLSIVFSLYCFARQNVSHLRSPSQDILLWYLEKSDRYSAVSALAGLSGLEEWVPFLPPFCHIQPGSLGGAIITVQEQKRSGDDDDVLYEKVSLDHWRVQCLVDLLSVNPHTGLAADFFLYCLKKLTPITSVEEGEELRPSSGDSLLDIEQKLTLRYQTQEQYLQLLQILSVLCEKISDSIFTDVKQVVEFVLMTLERACSSLATSEGVTVATQTLSMAMGLVAAMLGAVELTSSDFTHLKRLLPVLENLSRSHPEPVIQELASDLRVTIATHCAVPLTHGAYAGQDADNMEGKQQKPTKDHVTSDTLDIQELLKSATDNIVPTRAAALRTLTRLLELRHPKVIEHREQVMQLFLYNLEQEDSFVYLSAIQGVAVLSGDVPDRILPILLAQYGNAGSSKNKTLSSETRMKVGEALMRCTRMLGDMIIPHKDALFHAFLRGSRDSDSSLRASSLSNLGELCKQLQFSLGSVVYEVSSCLSALVRTDPEAEVRRAAIHVVVLLLRGLSSRATEVLRDVLLELYRLLKFVVQCEADSVCVLHAQLGLEELDSIMRAHLFPPQKLEKKIVVLP